MKPVIGITASLVPNPANSEKPPKVVVNQEYADRILEAGGIPLVVPFGVDPSEILGLIDGLLIPGGDDLDPALYGESPHPKLVREDPTRFELEKSLLEIAPAALPVFGICYGCQLLNVLRGGSLYQHLPDSVGHEKHAGGTLSRLHLKPGSSVYRIAGQAEIEGRSYHHQGVARLGACLEVTATDDDGTIEAIEANDRAWTIGVQWHPERTPCSEATRKLFRAFVEAASEYRRIAKLGGAGA
jgi:gamma-glutamyl-gamma-aminobutyrate hydrolase PuuD